MSTTKKAARRSAAPAAFRPRAVRDWRERYDPDADFVWNRAVLFNGVRMVLGAPVDKATLRPHRLRRLWRANLIQRV